MASRAFEVLLGRAREARLWVDALVADSELDYSRFYKEVYLVARGRWSSFVLAVKLVERRWYATYRMLRRWAAGLLARAKERGRRVVPVIIVPRLTRQAAVWAAARLRWAIVLPASVLSGGFNVKQMIADLVYQLLHEMLGKPSRFARMFAEEASRLFEARLDWLAAPGTGPPGVP